MFKAFDFYIPTGGTKVLHTPEWVHEIKYDGYRLTPISAPFLRLSPRDPRLAAGSPLAPSIPVFRSVRDWAEYG
jgi:hypothetical protein